MQTHTFTVERTQAGRPLVELLQSQLRLSRGEAMQRLRHRHVRVAGRPCADPQRKVRAGQRVQVEMPVHPPGKRDRPGRRPAPSPAHEQPALPALARDIIVRHADDVVLVVDKPAGLTTVRHADEAAEFGRRARKYLPATLVDLLPAVLSERGARGRGRPRAVHRLDRDTTGLLVLARTPEAETHLGRQFRAHTVGRTYLALVRGTARDETIESNLVRDRGDGRRGSSGTAEGQRAVTHVRVVEALGAYTLVECRLETGRTHQVRIHLGERGTPLCGERVYDRPPHGAPVPDGSGATRPLLHAASLEFDHPTTGHRMRWTAPLPPDMKQLLQRLRTRTPGTGGRGGRIADG